MALFTQAALASARYTKNKAHLDSLVREYAEPL
jgi:hypothetical protein